MTYKLFEEKLAQQQANLNEDSINTVLHNEIDLDYCIESGWYWEDLDNICPIKLKGLDEFLLAF